MHQTKKLKCQSSEYIIADQAAVEGWGVAGGAFPNNNNNNNATNILFLSILYKVLG